MSALLVFLAIASATLVSEDLTCLAVGLEIHGGRVGAGLAVGAATAGIYVGDLGLWLLGRAAGRQAGRMPWLAARLPAGRIERARLWLDRRGWAALLASRFLPGTRFTLYVSAGACGYSLRQFALWTGVAALAWVPLVVLLTARFGPAVADPLARVFGSGLPAKLATIAALFLVLRCAVLVATAEGRARLAASISRIWRWEFWPAWIFYAPVGLWIAVLSVRHGGLHVMTAANPGIPEGGFVGESKHDILNSLPGRSVLPHGRLAPAPIGARLSALVEHMRGSGWEYPIVLKPDSGQRGVGVKLIASVAEARSYLVEHSGPVLAQVYHPGPFEAGVFYYRLPDEPRGRIFAITDKHFPVLTGNGRATVRKLIWQHPRYRMQAATFFERHAKVLDRVLGPGEQLRLALAGNHVQGTLFRDGAHLWSPALETAIDDIARGFAGFYFGRFDVRYADVEAFKSGRDMAIVELNGVTSEATNIYDPAGTLLGAYRTLFRQWSLVFAIGATNCRRGHRPATHGRLISLAWRHARARVPAPVSD